MIASAVRSLGVVRAGEVFCVNAQCQDFKQRVIHDGSTLCRLRTDKGVFFFLSEQFEYGLPEQELRKGGQLTIGAHRLRDGSAWLHWFQLANGESWEPERQDLRWPLLGVGLILALSIVIFMMPSDKPMLIMVQTFLGIIGTVILPFTLVALVLWLHPIKWKLRRELVALKAGKPIVLSEGPSCSEADTLPLDDGVYGGVGLIQGVASEIGLFRIDENIRRYQLRCAGETFTLAESSGMLGSKSFVFRRQAPLFIGESDRIVLLTMVDDGEVHGVLNLTDGIAHANYHGSPYSPQTRRVAFGVVVGIVTFMALCLGGFTLYDWHSRGVGPDYWDWVELAEISGFFMMMFMMMFSGIGLIIWYIQRHSSRKISLHGIPVEKVVALALQWRLHNGRSPVINEFS
uniref:hypothetical protein n=1 Tax=Halomonas sp. TaxID=1486246 RepID=UPI002636B9BB|nr:hypothetical protein [Halomonas sp.]